MTPKLPQNNHFPPFPHAPSHDLLRPKIIHIYHLETLAELCTILKVEMLEDHVQQHSEELKAFEAICKQMLEDVQERLVYRTNIFIKEEVFGYQPSAGDVMYSRFYKYLVFVTLAVLETSQNRLH